MEQTPQPVDKQEEYSKQSSPADKPEASEEQHVEPKKHVVTSNKKIEISDEDHALDSGI